MGGVSRGAWFLSFSEPLDGSGEIGARNAGYIAGVAPAAAPADPSSSKRVGAAFHLQNVMPGLGNPCFDDRVRLFAVAEIAAL